MAILGAREEHVEPRLMRIAHADTVIWYKKPNLRFLYLILVPTALGVEWTSGFDSSMMNSLQAVESWVRCAYLSQRGSLVSEAAVIIPQLTCSTHQTSTTRPRRV